MSRLHISTPELDERNLSYEEYFRVIHVLLRHEALYLRKIHPNKSIDDIKAYPLIIIEKIVKITGTLYSVVVRNKDYVVSNIILRSLADIISSMILIYTEPDLEIKKIRHYLFIMDGLYGRMKNLPIDLKYDGKIQKEEYEQLKEQIDNAYNNYNEAYLLAKNEIQNLSIYKTHKQTIDILINNRKWKFKDISESNIKYYSWTELYSYANLPVDSVFFSLLSEFVHGLSTSNLLIDNTDETFEPILSIASSLIGKVLNLLNILYSNEIPLIEDKMVSALYDDDLPVHYVKSILSEFASRTNEKVAEN
ncbi:MAG: hypothetical protein IKB11_08225 [Bacteroidaceae bacterium]|nr:hypothetical protein [Bacteroidaceae bacterium]